MPTYFKEGEPTGQQIWESMSKQSRIDLIDKIEEQFQYEPFSDLLDQLLWRGVKDEALYDYLKDKVRLAIDFK